MTYQVVIEDGAARAIRKLSRDVQRLVIARIERLGETPRPPGSKKLEGADDLYRVRFGKNCVVCRIQDQALLVRVVRVAHRSEVYRRLSRG